MTEIVNQFSNYLQSAVASTASVLFPDQEPPLLLQVDTREISSQHC